MNYETMPQKKAAAIPPAILLVLWLILAGAFLGVYLLDLWFKLQPDGNPLRRAGMPLPGNFVGRGREFC